MIMNPMEFRVDVAATREYVQYPNNYLLCTVDRGNVRYITSEIKPAVWYEWLWFYLKATIFYPGTYKLSQIVKALSFCPDIPEDLFQRVTEKSQRSSEKESVKQAMLSDIAEIRYRKQHVKNFESFGIIQEHIAHNQKALVLKPLPYGMRLSKSFRDCLSEVAAIWPNSVTVYDDGSYRTKAELVKRIEDKLEQLDAEELVDHYGKHANGPNNAILKLLLGNVFASFDNRKVVMETYEAEKQARERIAYLRDVRSFLQSLGVTFFHCMDRIVTDSSLYYTRYVENTKRTIEEDEGLRLGESIHRVLLDLRRAIFQEVYFSIDTNVHDASTHRDVMMVANQEFNLQYPNFQSSDSYSGCAIRDKIDEVRRKFYERYNPIRIADYINALIIKSLKQQSEARDGRLGNVPQQVLYGKIMTFLEGTHSELAADLNNIFDLERNAFTDKAMQTMLEDFHIIRKNRN